MLPDKTLHIFLSEAIQPLYTINRKKKITLQNQFYIQTDGSKRHASPDDHALTEVQS